MFLSKGGRRVGLTTLPPSVRRLSRQCGIHNISKSCRPLRPVTGIALLLLPLRYRLSHSFYMSTASHCFIFFTAVPLVSFLGGGKFRFLLRLPLCALLVARLRNTRKWRQFPPFYAEEPEEWPWHPADFRPNCGPRARDWPLYRWGQSLHDVTQRPGCRWFHIPPQEPYRSTRH
jgi:hypothetical protein